MSGASSEFTGSPRFQLLERLGHGGMGVVYRALDRANESEVALKAMLRFDPDRLLRFKNEFRALQGIHHRNLVRLGELHEYQGHWFFTMELLDGVDIISHVCAETARDVPALSDGTTYTLRDTELMDEPAWHDGDTAVVRAVAAERAVAREYHEARLRAALEQLAHGLHALHKAGRVHRDIKPSNVLVTREGRLVILDFGLVSHIDARTDESRLLGTPAFMAPEQVVRADVGPEADWYSVGVLLYRALTGTLPHAGDVVTILRAKQRVRPLRPRAHNSSVPPEFDRLCRHLLVRDPGRRAGALEILAIVASRHKRLPTSTALADVATEVFIGRSDQLDQLRAARRASLDQGVTVLISGESGVGKSFLVRQFLGSLRQAPLEVLALQARCYESESAPYKGLDGIIDQLAHWLYRLSDDELTTILPANIGLLAGVFPALCKVPRVAAEVTAEPNSRPAVQELRLQAFRVLRELLGNMCDKQEVVLAIDDLQWADGDGMIALRELMRAPGAPRLLLVATARGPLGGPASKDFDQWHSECQRIHLAGLSADEARLLADTLLQRAGMAEPVRGGVEALIADAGGHPMFIAELCRYVGKRGQTSLGGLRLNDALGTRFSALDHRERNALAIIALAGAPLLQDIVAEAAELDPDDFAEVRSKLRARQFVRTHGNLGSDWIEPYHFQVGNAATEQLSAAERKRLHRRLAGALERADWRDVALVAEHWLRAGDRQKALGYMRRAADQSAAQLAFERAARLYRQCLELLATGTLDAHAMREALADALANAGRAHEAAEAYLQAADGAPGDAVELRARAAAQLLRSGHVDSGLEVVREVLADLDMTMPASPRSALVALLAHRARIRLRGLSFRERAESDIPRRDLARVDMAWELSAGLGIIDTIRGAEFQARHLRLALELGEPYRVARALSAEAAYRCMAGAGGSAAAARVLDASRSLARRLQRAHVHALNDLMAGMGAFLTGRWPDSVRYCEAAERVFLAECHDVSWEIDSARIVGLWGKWYTGALADLQRRLPELIIDAHACGDLYAETTYRSYFRPMALLARDRPELAAAESERALNPWSQQGFHFQHYFQLFAALQVDLYRGSFRAAVTRMREQWGALSRSMLLQVQQNRIEALHARARAELAMGRQHGPSGLVRRAASTARKIRRENTGWGDALAELLLAGVDDARGQEARCIARLEAAAEAFERHHMHLYLAATRRKLGARIGGSRGERLTTTADRWFAAEQVANPRAMADMLLAGIADRL